MPIPTPGELIGAIGQNIADLLDALDDNHGYLWPPAVTGYGRPAAVVELPAIQRSELDGAEDHLGQDDWRFDFEVNFYFDLNIKNPQVEQARAAALLGSYIAAVDAEPTLGLPGTVQEAKVVRVDRPEYTEEAKRPYIRWSTQLSVLAFV